MNEHLLLKGVATPSTWETVACQELAAKALVGSG